MQYVQLPSTSTISTTSTTSLATSINFNWMILHIRWVFDNLWDSLHYLGMVSTLTMEYINTAISGILSPHVLPITDLQNMLRHIADTLPPTLHLPISPEDTLHFYRCLHTHILIENKQFYYWLTCPYKIEPARSQCTRSLLWIFPMETIQPTMTWTPDTLWSHQRCNNESWTLYYTIPDMPTSQWTVLPHFHTFSAAS